MTANKADRRRPISTEEAVARDRAERRPIHHEYGSHHEAMGYLKRRHREKAGLMKQFTKLDGPCGVTNDYRDNWDRIFKGPQFEDVMGVLSEPPEQERVELDVLEVKRES